MDALLNQITSLRRATTKSGLAPHKPILLLALLESFDEGEIGQNWIEINEALLTRFYDLWNVLVNKMNTPNFALTFFHLSNERKGLWKLSVTPGKNIITTHRFTYKSLKVLKETFLGAQLSDAFYSAIINPQKRDMLKIALLNTYFPDSDFLTSGYARKYSEQIKKQILYDQEETTTGNIIRHVQKETFESTEEELILRNYIFRKTVLNTYNYQCAISGLKIKSPGFDFLVDACHIVPYAKKGDDSIRNGIALSPTLHRAFVNGLIAIDDNYKILVHPGLKDCYTTTGIRLVEQNTILLPRETEFYPSQQRLKAHRMKFGYE